MNGPARTGASAPVYEADFYADGFILDPQPHYAAMRGLGPVVWLSRHGNYAVTRYDEAREVLRNHQVFSSAHGVAADQFGCDFMKGNTIASDPPFHDLMRSTMGRPLTPKALEDVRSEIEAEAHALIDRLLARRSFDGMADLACQLPLTIVTQLVGLPEDGRENMLKWAAGGEDCGTSRQRCSVSTVRAQLRADIHDGPEYRTAPHQGRIDLCGPMSIQRFRPGMRVRPRAPDDMMSPALIAMADLGRPNCWHMGSLATRQIRLVTPSSVATDLFLHGLLP
jgi:cytochrome P450